jgi:hypothetical protein
MAQFVTDDTGDFIAAERIKEPGRGANCGVLRVSPGGESIGLWAVHQIDTRRWQVGALRQLAHDRDKFWRAALVDLLGAVH